MPATRRLQWSEFIAAPAARVDAVMTEQDTYRDWTSVFAEGSRYEGSWRQGERIRFLGPSGDGMLAEIAEHRPGEFISIRHLGFIANGVEDTESEAARAWAPAYENYTLQRVPEGTQLVIDLDVFGDFADFMAETWPQALALLKALCEAKR
jgi:uncharacterized protein YndB with AHSA1/START domain